MAYLGWRLAGEGAFMKRSRNRPVEDLEYIIT